MKIKSTLAKLTAPELITKAAELRRQIAKLRLEKFTGKNRNVRLVFNLRKHLAVTQTLLNSL